ncbi:MAG: TolC family protein [bacterium]
MQLIMKRINIILFVGLILASGIFAAKATPKKVVVVKQIPTIQATLVPEVESTQTKTVMSFDDCYKMAAEKNRDYKIAGLDKTAAEAQLSKATGSFGPTIVIAGGYEPFSKLASTLLPANSFGPGFPASDTALALMPQNYYSARVSLTQPIFTFGKTFFGVKMAEESYNIARINYKKAAEKLNLDVINSFYGALIAQEMAKTMQETLKSNEEYYRITKTKYANGQASNFDVLQAQVQFSNSVPDAQKADDGAKLSLQMLKNTIGIPLDENIKLSGVAEYKKFDFTYKDMLKQFKEKNDDKEIVESVANIAKLNRNLQAAMFLPNIALNANYNYYSTEKAFHTESAYWQNSWDVTIGFQWTVFDSFKNVASLKEAEANTEKADLNKENIDNMLAIQLEQLYTSLEQNRQVIEAADDLIKTAQEGYRIAKESYKNGLIQSVDLLNAENGLLKAKMNYLSAMFNYITTAQKLKDFIN